MANFGHPGQRTATAIAGPRRARPVPDGRSAAAPAIVPARAKNANGPRARELPSLDYDETSARTRIAPPPKSLVDLTTTTLTSRTKRFRWFVIGVAMGALIVSVVRGDAAKQIKHARAWGADQLRALKSNPPVQIVPAAPTTSLANTAPCTLTDEECAMLLAPFAAANALPEQQQSSVPVPEVDVMSLPKVKPPVAYVAPKKQAATAEPSAPDTASAPPDEATTIFDFGPTPTPNATPAAPVPAPSAPAAKPADTNQPIARRE